MSVLPFDLTDKAIQPSFFEPPFNIPSDEEYQKANSRLPFALPIKAAPISKEFLFLTGREDLSISRKRAAEAARVYSETFIHKCPVHDLATHFSSNGKCIQCSNDYQARWRHENKGYLAAKDTCKRMGLSYRGVRDIIGYTEQEFTRHIESLWTDGMSWDNYGTKGDEWSIDHKVPVSHFIKTGETDIAVINALSNLQPLWHSDNMKKRDSLEYVTG